jgi:hypothetical protein
MDTVWIANLKLEPTARERDAASSSTRVWSRPEVSLKSLMSTLRNAGVVRAGRGLRH